MDTTFPHRYRVRMLTELPASESLPRYYYPGASREGGRDGVLLEVRPEHGRPWVGVFGFGEFPSSGVSGIFTTPHPRWLCVVTRGEGYWVCTADPTRWESVKADPVLDVRPVAAQRILVFADYTGLVAYGEAGLRWQTRSLVSDDLRIVEVTDRFIEGEGFVYGEAGITFCVDLTTGRHEGGIPESA